MKPKLIVGLVIGLVLGWSWGIAAQDSLRAIFEKSLGQAAKDQIVALYGGETDLPFQQHLVVYDILNRLTAAVQPSEYQYSLTVLKSNEANAFALPGGYILITEGILRLAGSDENRIGAVLAHEMAHVEQRHGLNAVLRQIGLSVIVEVGAFILEAPATEAVRVATQALVDLVQSGYSREAEMEADALGQQYLVGAGLDPAGIIHILFDLDHVAEGRDRINWFSSHPLISERAERMLTALVSFWSPLDPIAPEVTQPGVGADPFGRFEFVSSQDPQGGGRAYDQQNEGDVSWLSDLVLSHLIFSPDGLTLAAVGRQETKHGLFIYNRFGNFIEYRPLAGGSELKDIVFAPDGKKLAYLCREDNKPNIYIDYVGEVTSFIVAPGFEGEIIGWDSTGLIVADEAHRYYRVTPPPTLPPALSNPIPRVIERKPRVTPTLTGEDSGDTIRLIRPHIYEF